MAPFRVSHLGFRLKTSKKPIASLKSWMLVLSGSSGIIKMIQAFRGVVSSSLIEAFNSYTRLKSTVIIYGASSDWFGKDGGNSR